MQAKRGKGKYRFLFISTQLENGGAQVKGVTLAAELRRRGHDAQVWFLYRKRLAFGANEQDQCLLARRPLSVGDFVTVLVRLNRLIRGQRPDVVIGLAHYASPLSCAIAWLQGVPTRLATQCGLIGAFPRPAAWLDWLAGMVGAYTANISASEAVQAAFARFPAGYRRRLRVIQDGIQLSTSSLDWRAARHQFSLPEDVPLLVHMGRLTKSKNQSHLFDVLERLPAVHLAILGEGELRSELQKIVDGKGLYARVHMLGEINHERVPDFLRCGDVFVFPSLYEGFGLAVIEAMHVGLPVVASNVQPLSDLIGGAGVLLPPSNADAWANGILELLADVGRRSELGRRGKARAAKFSIEVMADEYEAIVRGP